MNKLEDTYLKIAAVNVLRALKENLTYRELTKETGIPIVSLNRYINGLSLPRKEVARKIVEKYQSKKIVEIVMEKSRWMKEAFYSTHELITSPSVLTLIAREVKKMFPINNVTKILTAASDGIPLALKIAEAFGCNFAFAKRMKEVGFKSYYVSERVSESIPVISPLYLPKKLLGRKDRVLLVDDVIRTGTTQIALKNIVLQARARLIGCFSIFATKKSIERLSNENINVRALIID